MSDWGCAACGQTFGTLTMFDAHQDVDYNRRPAVACSHPEALGLVRDTWGTWQTPEGLKSRTRRAERLPVVRRARAAAALEDGAA